MPRFFVETLGCPKNAVDSDKSVASLLADGLEPGVHQVVWEGFNKPGIYTVYDYDLPDQPEVMSSFNLREGLEIDIRTDGSGETRKCP